MSTFSTSTRCLSARRDSAELTLLKSEYNSTMTTLESLVDDSPEHHLRIKVLISKIKDILFLISKQGISSTSPLHFNNIIVTLNDKIVYCEHGIDRLHIVDDLYLHVHDKCEYCKLENYSIMRPTDLDNPVEYDNWG